VSSRRLSEGDHQTLRREWQATFVAALRMCGVGIHRLSIPFRSVRMTSIEWDRCASGWSQSDRHESQEITRPCRRHLRHVSQIRTDKSPSLHELVSGRSARYVHRFELLTR
jgi:hypothetical protein